MKERYEVPKAEIEKFDTTAVICTSGCGSASGKSGHGLGAVYS